MAYALDRTICIQGYLAQEDGSPDPDAPAKDEFNVSAFDPTVGGPYGAYLYMSDCEPEPDVTVIASTISCIFKVLQPARVYSQ